MTAVLCRPICHQSHQPRSAQRSPSATTYLETRRAPHLSHRRMNEQRNARVRRVGGRVAHRAVRAVRDRERMHDRSTPVIPAKVRLARAAHRLGAHEGDARDREGRSACSWRLRPTTAKRAGLYATRKVPVPSQVGVGAAPEVVVVSELATVVVPESGAAVDVPESVAAVVVPESVTVVVVPESVAVAERVVIDATTGGGSCSIPVLFRDSTSSTPVYSSARSLTAASYRKDAPRV